MGDYSIDPLLDFFFLHCELCAHLTQEASLLECGRSMEKVEIKRGCTFDNVTYKISEMMNTMDGFNPLTISQQKRKVQIFITISN